MSRDRLPSTADTYAPGAIRGTARSVTILDAIVARVRAPLLLAAVCIVLLLTLVLAPSAITPAAGRSRNYWIAMIIDNNVSILVELPLL